MLKKKCNAIEMDRNLSNIKLLKFSAIEPILVWRPNKTFTGKSLPKIDSRKNRRA